jgi:hypothetical protein
MEDHRLKLNFSISSVARFISLDALPAETAPRTRRRLAEVLEGAPVAAKW